jgi:hypothetical protein
MRKRSLILTGAGAQKRDASRLLEMDLLGREQPSLMSRVAIGLIVVVDPSERGVQ